jgi:hypothetical protein
VVEELLAAFKTLEAMLEKGSCGESEEELTVDPLEEELDERKFDACEEVERLLKGWEDKLFWEGKCDWSFGGREVEVVLYGGTVTVPSEILETVRGVLEKHGLTVERFEIEVDADDYVAEVAIRFHVALPAEDEQLLAGCRWLFASHALW